MIKTKLVRILIIIAVNSSVEAQEMTACKILSNKLSYGSSGWLEDSPIKLSGNYCLEGSAYAKHRFSISEGFREIANGEPLITIVVSNVNIDLKGYSLNSDKVINQRQEGFKYELLTHVNIKNGVTIGRTAEGITLGENNMGYKPMKLEWGINFGSDRNDFNCNAFNPALVGTVEPNANTCIYLDNHNKTLAQIRNNFPLTEHTIDNVKVSAENIGIGIKGGGNIIRNSIIKIGENDMNWGSKSPQQVYDEGKSWGGGTASIYLFGPNQLIENNIIIFKGKTRTSRSSAAPIKIHAADGTIIRNNTIIIESSSEDIPQTAISIFDSKNVVIENNQIFGTKSVYKIWDEEDNGSSVIENGTTFPSSWKKPHTSF